MSGTVDARIPLSARPPENNMLEQALKTIGVGQGAVNLQRSAEELRAQREIGRALQSSVDRETGVLDPAMASAMIANNPQAALLAGHGMMQNRQLQGVQAQAQQQEVLLGVMRLSNVANALNGLLANPNITREEVVKQLSVLASLPANERPFPPATAAAIASTMPSNPDQIRQWIMQQAASTAQSLQGLQLMLPQPFAVNDGSGTHILNRNQYDGNRVTPAPGVPFIEQMPGPDQLGTPQTVVGPDGQPMQAPRGSVMPQPGGRGTPSPGAVQPSRPAPAGGGPLGTGRLSQSEPPTSASPTPSGAPVGAVPTGMPPAAQAAAVQEGARSADQINELTTAAREAPQIDAALAHMDRLVRQFASGPGADWQRVAQGFTNRLLPDSMKMDAEGLASQEKFNKLAMELLQRQFRALGGTGSNDQFAAVATATPTELISRMGNLGLIATLRGNNDAIRVMQREWEKYRGANPGTGPEKLGQWLANEWNPNFDYRVFQAKYMKPEDRGKMFSAMSPDEKRSYLRALSIAAQRGWINIPQGGANAPAR